MHQHITFIYLTARPLALLIDFAGTQSTLPFNSIPPPSLLRNMQHSGNVPPVLLDVNQPSQAPNQHQHPTEWQNLYNWFTPTAPTGGMSLSISSRPVPARLVQQIRAGWPVEMRDQLWDNVVVRRHNEELHGAMAVQLLPVIFSRPRLREVATLPAWICCFLTYLAVSTSDVATCVSLTYAMLLVREALRHGGQGWMEYDRLFRQQAAIDASLPWNSIQPSPQATTILGQRTPRQGLFCTLCQECDHMAAQCALGQLQQTTTQGSSNQGGTPGPSRGSQRICASWNDGACLYPGTCNFRHICSKCFRSSHKAKNCRAQPRSRGSPTTPGPSQQPPMTS